MNKGNTINQNVNLKQFSVGDLLNLYSNILDELQERTIIRTRNNPIADYAEWLASKKLGLLLQSNSKSGYDALDSNGVRYQIKCRRIDLTNNSRQLGVIRKLELGEFDYLIAIIFNKDFSINNAYKIPHGIIGKYSRYSPHQNGYILHLRGKLLYDKSVKEITTLLR